MSSYTECSELVKPNRVGLRQCLSTSRFLNSWPSNQYFAVVVTLLECRTYFFFTSFNYPMKRLRCPLVIDGSRLVSEPKRRARGSFPFCASPVLNIKCVCLSQVWEEGECNVRIHSQYRHPCRITLSSCQCLYGMLCILNSLQVWCLHLPGVSSGRLVRAT